MRSRAIKLAAVLSLGMLISVGFTPVVSAQSGGGSSGSPSLACDSHQVEGNSVQVTVRNSASMSKLGWVKVEAIVGGKKVQSLVPVNVAGNQQAQASAGFTGKVQAVIVVGH